MVEGSELSSVLCKWCSWDAEEKEHNLALTSAPTWLPTHVDGNGPLKKQYICIIIIMTAIHGITSFLAKVAGYIEPILCTHVHACKVATHQYRNLPFFRCQNIFVSCSPYQNYFHENFET